MIKFTETNRIMEAKVGDYFYKLIIKTENGEEKTAIMRTKAENTRTGFGSYACVPMVQTVDRDGSWKNLINHEHIWFPSIDAATKFIL